MTIMLINKTTATQVSLSVANFQHASTAQVSQLASNNPITRLADSALTGNTWNGQLPAQSITLVVLAASSGPTATPTPSASPSKTPTPSPTPTPILTPSPTPLRTTVPHPPMTGPWPLVSLEIRK